GASEPRPQDDTLVLPSYEQAVADKHAFADLTKIAHNETNPYNARRLVQAHDREAIVANPPAFPLSEAEMDVVYGLPYTRRPHPSYGEQRIPAYEVVKHSVQIMRGCFGGCTFCSITAHEGRIIQSRSHQSVMNEVRQMTADPEFTGVVSDIGGPTANMYQMRCTKPEVEAVCRRLSCVYPTICKLLGTDHGPLVQLMKDVREAPGVKQVFVASGIRMDLARRSPEYMRELVEHHVGGYLKVAPEHVDPNVLHLMKKPTQEDFVAFDREFKQASAAAGKKQYLVPYFIASHPGSDLDSMIELALFLKRNHYKPDQVQDFIPSPFDIAACMYHTGLDPFTKKPVYIAKHLRDRKLQRALLQFFKPENYFEVRKALEQAGRQDLIGRGCDCLIPAQPPKEAIEARRRGASDPDHYHAIANPEKGDKAGERGVPNRGYRPGRKSARRQDRDKRKGGSSGPS
ncbi:MAG TPA: YgiQ family radical SAM protein, partial [Pirellulales bacterium]